MKTQGGVPASVQAYLPISEIREGVVVLKDGSFKAIISVMPLNFGLKSEQEKNSVIYSYQAFLNSLEFPIQLLALSRRLDLTNYLAEVETVATKESNPFIKLQVEEYKAFITALLAEINIMDKEFFVVVPYYPLAVEAGKGGLFGTKKKGPGGKFDEHVAALQSRVEQVLEGLGSMGLNCRQLTTEQNIEIFYSLYNPDTAKNEKLSAVLNTMQNQIVEGGPKA
jgi:hypothetical protein